MWDLVKVLGEMRTDDAVETGGSAEQKEKSPRMLGHTFCFSKSRVPLDRL